jgi:hypothetical protein
MLDYVLSYYRFMIVLGSLTLALRLNILPEPWSLAVGTIFREALVLKNFFPSSSLLCMFFYSFLTGCVFLECEGNANKSIL